MTTQTFARGSMRTPSLGRTQQIQKMGIRMTSEPLTDEYLKECEQRARQFSGAYTGTSGTLAAMLLHCIAEVRRLQGKLAVTIAQRDERPDLSFIRGD